LVFNFCCFLSNKLTMQLHCWFGVKILLMFPVTRPIRVFVPGHRNFMCFVRKVFESQRLLQFISGWIQWNNAVLLFSGSYAISCHSRSNILAPIDRGWHLFLRHSLAVNPWAHSDAHTLRRVKMRHRVKFCADRSNRCGDMAVFDFSRWRPSAILDLLYACLWNGNFMYFYPLRNATHPETRILRYNLSKSVQWFQLVWPLAALKKRQKNKLKSTYP